MILTLTQSHQHHCIIPDLTVCLSLNLLSEEVKIISQPSAQAGPQPYTQNYPPYGRPPIQYPDYGGYVLNDLPPLGYGSLPGPAGRPNDYERYNPSRTNTTKSEPNVNRVKRGKLNFILGA